jgi:glycosyltransferase involved in cell wall biosynthesis
MQPSICQPTVSVIIPTYNNELYMRQTLDSVLQQESRYPIEVIVVDDGSKDQTPEIVASYHPRVRLICQANLRVSAARNNGFLASTGDYVCFMDHDDWWHPKKIERQVEELERDTAVGACYTNFKLWEPNTQGRFDIPNREALEIGSDDVDLQNTGWNYHQLLIDNWMLTSATMIRRKALEDCGTFDVSLPYAEEWDLFLRISRKYRVVKLQRIYTLYRQHPNQGSREPRDVDYRTKTIESALRSWGRASPDGTSVSYAQIQKQLSRYHASYGMHMFAAGRRAKGARALFAAWTRWPINPKPLLCAVLGCLKLWPRA